MSKESDADREVGVNFFTWIREGVKQSVLLGVADAVEHLGAPPEGDNSSQKLLSFLRDDSSPSTTSKGRKGQPRRLGRSLRDIEAEKAAG